jgi:hypothetical protein
MLRATRVICVSCLALLLSGCACSYPPIFGQGPPRQPYNFGRFDPYPDRLSGPALDGVRPPGAEHQRSEPVRSQAPYSNSSRGAVLVP